VRRSKELQIVFNVFNYSKSKNPEKSCIASETVRAKGLFLMLLEAH
jgi:hypothetical protein